jgi:hypothetical protein
MGASAWMVLRTAAPDAMIAGAVVVTPFSA